MQIFKQVILQITSGEMIFMDYRFALTAAMETTYTDALGRPKLHLAGFNMFRSGFMNLYDINIINLIYILALGLEQQLRCSLVECSLKH